jgi:hypothetical protein
MKYFDSLDLSVVLMGKFLFPWTWLSSYERSCSIDLVVVLWKTFRSTDLVVVLWRVLFFVAIDLIVVLWMCICIY